MTKQELALIIGLIEDWIDDLAEEIQRLDGTLPLEHEREAKKVYIGHRLLWPLLVNQETHPEEFGDVEVLLPLAELNRLRQIGQTMEKWVRRLQFEAVEGSEDVEVSE